jgi:hypothetical protein
MRRNSKRQLPLVHQKVLETAPDDWSDIRHLGDSHYALQRAGKIEIRAIDDAPGWRWRKTPPRAK